MRDRIIAVSPCDGIRLPKRRRKDSDDRILAPAEVPRDLVPAMQPRYRALVILAAGTGLRWRKCIELRWDAVDLEAGELRVIGTAVEVFTNEDGGPIWRGHFRSRYWRPALVRAGMLGGVVPAGPDRWIARWADRAGLPCSTECGSHRQALDLVVRKAANGLRFHDLRHGYATWLVSRGLPINGVQQVMGRERPSTTLDLYTHRSSEANDRVRDALGDDPPSVES
jgi:integrase